MRYTVCCNTARLRQVEPWNAAHTNVDTHLASDAVVRVQHIQKRLRDLHRVAALRLRQVVHGQEEQLHWAAHLERQVVELKHADNGAPDAFVEKGGQRVVRDGVP